MNWANVCLVPTGGGLPSENLRSIVRDYLLEWQPITVRIRFLDPEYIRVVFGMDVYVEPGYSQENIRIQITDGVREFFALENVRFGQDIRTSRFYKMAMDIDGVDHLTVDDFSTYDRDTGLTTVVGQELILKKWQVPMLESFVATMHESMELPEPDLYPDEEDSEYIPELWKE